MSGADPNLDPDKVELLRDYPGRAGWLEAELRSARDTMVLALDVVRRSRSWDGKKAAGELGFQIARANETLALIAAADAKNAERRSPPSGGYAALVEFREKQRGGRDA